MATPSRPLSVLLFATALVGSPVRSADSLATVSPFGIGPYTVACNNLSQDFARLLPGESAEDYWNGNPDGSRTRYVTNLLSDPAHAFDISVSIPADSELYGRFAGTAIDVVSVICYPTASNNPRPDYPLPTGKSIPHMQQGADAPVWPDATTIFPVLVFSHGLSGSSISSDYLDAIKVFASWGYVVVSPFHGDRRVADITIENLSDFGYALLHYKDFIAMQALRPLELEATLNAFLTRPEWSARVDPNRIGAFGGSLGGESVLLLGGASLTTTLGLASKPVLFDSHIKAAVGYVPYFGQSFFPAFGRDQAGLDNVLLPFLAISGTAEPVARPPRMLPGDGWVVVDTTPSAGVPAASESFSLWQFWDEINLRGHMIRAALAVMPPGADRERPAPVELPHGQQSGPHDVSRRRGPLFGIPGWSTMDVGTGICRTPGSTWWWVAGGNGAGPARGG